MQKTIALVLKKQNIGETDRILTVFSPTLGKKRVVVRAVRKPLSKLAGHLDTFMISELMLTDEPDLPKVTAANLTESFAEIRQSLALTNRAFTVSKIIERVILEDIPQQTIFRLTVEALGRIEREQNWPIVWLYFLGRLTSELGLGITNFRCLKCQQSIQDQAYWLIQDHAFGCRDCFNDLTAVSLEANSVKLLSLLRSKPIEQLTGVKVPELNIKQVEEVLLREVADWLNKPWSTYSSFS